MVPADEFCSDAPSTQETGAGVLELAIPLARRVNAAPYRARGFGAEAPATPRSWSGHGGGRQAIGSSLMYGRLSQRLPAATMQLTPVGVVLTTVHVPWSLEA